MQEKIKVAARELPIVMQEVVRERSEPTNVVTHDIEKITGEGETRRTTKCKKNMPVLDSTKDKYGFVLWCEEVADLIIAKGANEDTEACKEISLSMMGGIPKD